MRCAFNLVSLVGCKYNASLQVKKQLGGTLNHFLFSPQKFGKMNPFLTHIVQMGCFNHQLENLRYVAVSFTMTDKDLWSLDFQRKDPSFQKNPFVRWINEINDALIHRICEESKPKDDVFLSTFLPLFSLLRWVLDSNFANLAHQVLGNRGLVP